MADPTITGPSNTGPDPVITLGTVASPVVRTGVQLLSGEFIVQGLDLWDVVSFSSPEQRTWTALALTGLVCIVQNLVEKAKGRRLIGAAR